MFGVRRFALVSLLAVAIAPLLVSPALAQDPPPPPPPLGPTPPCYPECEVEVVIEPGTSTVFSPALDVDVTFCGEANLNSSSRLIKLRGTDVTDDFTYTSGGSSECVYVRKRLSEDEITLTTGTNSFYAYICDVYNNCSSKTVTFTYTLNEEPPSLELVNHNGDNRDRSMCLTAGAGEAGAYQCGDLMVAHSMPGYATKGKDRALTLIYNSSQAEPRPVVAVNVTNSDTTSLPDEIEAVLVVGTDTASASYTAWTDDTKQVVLGLDASHLSSGLYEFTFKVRNVYSGGPQTSDVITDTLIVVNRSTSEFGRGWGVAGVEELVKKTDTNDLLWVGGDGSAKRYRYLTTNTWQAAVGAYRDTLVRVSGDFKRTLRHGVEVWYEAYEAVGSDTIFKHTRTVNRAADATRLTWSGTPLRLQSIRVPPDTAINGNTYTFGYDGSSKLDSIADPAGRELEATVTSGELLRLTDPDAEYVDYDYDAQGRMIERTNRRGVTTEYAYDNDLRLTDVIIPLNVTAGDTATTTYSTWDERGLALGTGSTNVTAVRSSIVNTWIDGPRTVSDISQFWIDRWGAPTKIRNPLYKYTDITRSTADSTAGLPTEVEYPDGRVVKMSWNARANLKEQRDSSATNERPTAVTTWTYGDTDVPDSPTAIEAPDGEDTAIEYNATGLPDTVTAPNGHLTVFEYGSGKVNQGLVTKVIEEDVAILDTSTWADSDEDLETRFAYDSLGNVAQDTSALDNVRTFVRDSAQRVVMVIDAVSDTVKYVYDPLNRIEEFKQHAEAGVLTTTYTYDEDFLTEVEDPRGVTRSYTYDDAGRLTRETDEQDEYDEHGYDETGLRMWTVTRNLRSASDTIKMRYDAAGNLLARSWPEVQDDVTAPADSIKYTYDEVGRIKTAQNYASPAFTITRTWYDNGLLKSEERKETATGSNEASVTYAYTVGGKDSLKVIGDSGATEPDSVWYRYDANEQLDRIVVAWGYGSTVKDSVQFDWDELGRRKALTYSARSGVAAPIELGFSYDEEGRAKRICSEHTGDTTPTGDDIFKIRVGLDYNADGTMSHRDMYDGTTHSDTVCDDSNNWVNQGAHDYEYDKRKQMVEDYSERRDIDFAYDSSANLVYRSTQRGDTSTVEKYEVTAGSNRLATYYPDTTSAYNIAYTYYDDGSRKREWPSTMGYSDYRKYYPDGLGRLALVERYSYWLRYSAGEDGGYAPDGAYIGLVTDTVPSCKYDPLGRLIDACGSDAVRLTYDGGNVVRTGEDDDDLAWTFVHGPGIDDPLMAHRAQSEYDHVYLYYVTDGNGRQLAVGDSIGRDYANPDSTAQGAAGSDAVEYIANGGKYAGGMHDSYGFEAERNPSTGAPELSFFRNRWFDQKTGRWTQEDPLGVAAGTNLYNYVGNNPASLTDPFGLCPPKESCDLLLLVMGARSLGNARTQGHIQGLTAETQVRATQLVNLSRLSGHNLVVTEGFRSPEEQARRYAVGRQGIEGEAIVTSAKPGQSRHQSGEAFDTAIIEDGVAIYDLERFRTISGIGNLLGLRWGGHFPIVDGPHFELPQ